MTAEHAASVPGIYATGNASFETAAPPWEAFDAARPAGNRYVAVDTGGHHRHHPDRHLPGEHRRPPLHTRCGFRTIGARERVARHHGRRRDVILLERRSPTVT